jgi:hypothetical protein
MCRVPHVAGRRKPKSTARQPPPRYDQLVGAALPVKPGGAGRIQTQRRLGIVNTAGIQRTEGPRTVIVRALIGHAALLRV